MVFSAHCTDSVQTTNTAPGLDISSNDTPIEESSSENPELVAGKVGSYIVCGFAILC